MKNESQIPKLEDYQPILDAAKNGKLVLFIGNGVSRLLGYPSWDEMASNALLNLFDENKNVRHIDFIEKELIRKLLPKKQLSIIHDICNFKRIELNYKQIIVPDDKKKQKKIYETLYSMKTPFVTTNYDDCLDKEAELSSFGIEYADQPTTETSSHVPIIKKVVYKFEDLTTAKLDQGVVVHIHGSIKNEGKMVISTKNYIQNYERGNFVDKFLEGLFDKNKGWVILFIGYGLEEEEILEYIVGRGQIDTKSKEKPDHFCLYPKLGSGNAILGHLENYYKNHCNVKLIPYAIDVKGHDILEEIINDWAPKIKEVAHKKNYIEEQSDFMSLLS